MMARGVHLRSLRILVKRARRLVSTPRVDRTVKTRAVKISKSEQPEQRITPESDAPTPVATDLFQLV